MPPKKQEGSSESQDHIIPETAILTTKHKQILGFIAFVAVTATLIYALIFQNQFELPVPQFIFCAAIATYLSIFFFVFYPAQFELQRIPVINLPVRVTGPIVLWIVVLWLLLSLIPKTDQFRYIRFFDPEPFARALSQPLIYFTGDTNLQFLGPKPLRYHLVFEGNPRSLTAIYVEFSPRISAYQAQFTHHQKSINVTLNRSGEPAFKNQ